jgi:hypothetical protein
MVFRSLWNRKNRRKKDEASGGAKAVLSLVVRTMLDQHQQNANYKILAQRWKAGSKCPAKSTCPERPRAFLV